MLKLVEDGARRLLFSSNGTKFSGLPTKMSSKLDMAIADLHQPCCIHAVPAC